MKLLRVAEAIVILLMAGFLLFSVFDKQKLNYNCSDFRNQGAALNAYRDGAVRLDGDRDGIPCESLHK